MNRSSIPRIESTISQRSEFRARETKVAFIFPSFGTEGSVCEDDELEDDLPDEEAFAPGESLGEVASLVAEESVSLAAEVSVGAEDTVIESLLTSDSAEGAPSDSSFVVPATEVSVLRTFSFCVLALPP